MTTGGLPVAGSPDGLAAGAEPGRVTAVIIPWDACICEGRVTRPRGNCWATVHDLRPAHPRA